MLCVMALETLSLIFGVFVVAVAASCIVVVCNTICCTGGFHMFVKCNSKNRAERNL